MDKVKDFFETLIRAIPLHGLEEDTAQLVRDALHSKAAAAIDNLIEEIKKAAAPFVSGPIPGAPVDEDLPAAPDHWSREEPAAIDNAPAPAAPAGQPIVETPEPADNTALDAALAKLGPAPGNAGLPSTSLAAQTAAATPPAS
jgi:hypothetical protein